MQKFHLVFENTGDCLPVIACHDELFCYIFDQINRGPIQLFSVLDKSIGQRTLSNLKNLQEKIININDWFKHLTGEIYPELLDVYDYLDQDLLNYLHAYWVKSQSKNYDIQLGRKNGTPLSGQIADIFPDDLSFPTIASVISRLGLSEQYDMINTYVHAVESVFWKIQFDIKATDWIEWPNPYPHFVSNDICNLYLDFNHLGRTLENKYECFDFDIEHDDENSFFQIVPRIALSLRPPRRVPYSPEYKEWCESKNRIPVGNLMPLGNIPDLYENLKKYRIIIVKNLLSNNGITLQKD